VEVSSVPGGYKCVGRGGVAGSQPMSAHGAQMNLGDLTPYLTYGQNL